MNQQFELNMSIFSTFIFMSLLLPTVCLLGEFSQFDSHETKINEENLLSHFFDPLQDPPSSVIVFEPTPKKQFIYVAVHHTNDLKGAVACTIKSLIETKQPDVCVLEGFPVTEGFSPERIIGIADERCSTGKCGENLYSARLCHYHQIPFIGGDIEESEYIEAFKAFGISQKDIVFFLLVQQIPLWHRDGEFFLGNPKEQFENFMRDSVSIWLKIQPVNYTYEDFLSWHLEHMKKTYNPEKDFVSAYELQPSLQKNATIYQKICAYTVYLRDKHIVRLIQQLMMENSTVLVVYGATHYANQADILTSLFGPPKSCLKIE